MKFGDYLRDKREKSNLKAKVAAKNWKISPGYLSSLENGKRSAPSFDLLTEIADSLELSRDDRNMLYDLAAESKNPPELPRDITEYVYQNPVIRDLLRYAMTCKLQEKEWNVIFNFVKSNYKY